MKKDILEIALSQYGVKEIVGKEHNAAVVAYFKDGGFDEVDNDEMAWCSAFVNWCAVKAKLVKSGSLLARSWLKVGKEITTPQMGDVVVLSRGSKAWMGHVGFYISEDLNYVYVLGGNQGNQVNIKPYYKSKVLGYRRLTKK